MKIIDYLKYNNWPFIVSCILDIFFISSFITLYLIYIYLPIELYFIIDNLYFYLYITIFGFIIITLFIIFILKLPTSNIKKEKFH